MASLDRLRILLVEDEALVSMMAEDVLTDAGYDVVLATTLSAALQIAEFDLLDAAVLDVNLGLGQNSFAIAAHLTSAASPSSLLRDMVARD